MPRADVEDLIGISAYKKFVDTVLSDRLMKLQVPTSHVPYILVLNRKRGMTQTEISERIGVNKSMTTSVIRALIENGYAENRSTGKNHSIYLTEEGVKIKGKVRWCVRQCFEYLYSDLTEEERAVMSSVEEKVRRRMQEYESLSDG